MSDDDDNDDARSLRSAALRNAHAILEVRKRADDELVAAKKRLEEVLDAERAARTELERMSTMKDEFLATLSHELRTPLNSILGWSEALLSRLPEDSEYRRGLETIARNAKAQAHLIDDLLDMNRIISGKIRLDVQRLDVAPIIEAALDSVRPSAMAKAIQIHAVLDPHAGPVSGDPNRLHQVVWNLVTNALKFTPKSGRIEVLLALVSSHIEISVSDTGLGIAADVLPHVFERFRQADSSTTRKYGGLGLGLSIVRQLVELHGGSVHAESDGVGTGTTFVVRLPLMLAHPTDDQHHPRTGQYSPLRSTTVPLAGLRLLVVDDEPDSRDLACMLLSAAGANVSTAASADDCLAQLGALRPHVIISDIGMPDKDGYQLMREVRRLTEADGGRTPAIALTAFARSEDRTRAMLAGYQAHIAKPIQPQELVATVGSLAGRIGDDDADGR